MKDAVSYGLSTNRENTWGDFVNRPASVYVHQADDLPAGVPWLCVVDGEDVTVAVRRDLDAAAVCAAASAALTEAFRPEGGGEHAEEVAIRSVASGGAAAERSEGHKN